jgi:iron-sulfur cluster assembly accessory protein
MERELQIQDLPVLESAEFNLELTDLAAERAAAMMHQRGLAAGALRVTVSGGGCSGYQYSLGFDDQQRAGDIVLDCRGVRVVVDRGSAALLNGVVIDYVNALHGAGFKFVNPNASRTCGCGTSFSV